CRGTADAGGAAGDQGDLARERQAHVCILAGSWKWAESLASAGNGEQHYQGAMCRIIQRNDGALRAPSRFRRSPDAIRDLQPSWATISASALAGSAAWLIGRPITR